MISDHVMVLCDAVSAMITCCTVLSTRLDTIKIRLNDLISKQDTTDTKFATLVEAQQAVISTISTLTKKLDVIIFRPEQMNGRLPLCLVNGRVQIPTPLLLPHLAPANRRVKFDYLELHIIWNARGIRNLARLATLKDYAYWHQPTVI